jgi:hypothetical protein
MRRSLSKKNFSNEMIHSHRVGLFVMILQNSKKEHSSLSVPSLEYTLPAGDRSVRPHFRSPGQNAGFRIPDDDLAAAEASAIICYLHLMPA